MGAIYQLIFFLAIALLAITITVFVLAVSLLGRAVRLSVEEQEKAEKDRKEDNDKQMQEIRGELDSAEEKSIQPDIKRLDKILKGLKRKERIHLLKLWWIGRKPGFLRVSWGALIPGAFFITAIVMSALALYWADETSTASIYMWLAVASMFVGICLVYLTLKVIEGVAITSEETAFLRQKDMFKTTLRELDEERKPKLELEFRDEKLPLHIEPEAQKEIKFTLYLTSGDIARKPEVMFFVPEGFDFPSRKTIVQPEELVNVGGHITTTIDFEDCRKGINLTGSIVIKAPPKIDTYDLWYQITCENFVGPDEKFKVKVE